MSVSVNIEFADSRWRKIRGLSVRLTLAAERALRKAGGPRKGALTILLTDDARLKTLNLTFRGKDSTTNVLSFPAAPNDEGYLGDLALAYGVTHAEARAENKRFADHATHLVVHGVLHLLGFDHVLDDEARQMESLETAVLATLGIADPYNIKAA